MRIHILITTIVITVPAGGTPMFLGSQDIQLGVNESLLDTTKVISSMTHGIMARVGPHSDIEVINGIKIYIL